MRLRMFQFASMNLMRSMLRLLRSVASGPGEGERQWRKQFQAAASR